MNDAPETPNSNNGARDYRKTVFLPQTGFPMKADLPNREPKLLAKWAAAESWKRLREKSKGRPPFVLHDGPPYANGPLHIGHALNKILKDVINRAAQMSGTDADYVPGWDCHGLPIEWKVEEEYRAKKLDKDQVPVLEFRAECRAYAKKWLAVQSEEFQRLGVAGDWANRYATMDFPAESVIVEEIGRFLMNGSLYRGLRPVMWSPVEKTALAEAEIEYMDHVSPTLHALFRVLRAPAMPELVGSDVVIWTTTPWTIPGNRALAYGPEIQYALLHVDSVAEGALVKPGARLLVALALLPQFCTEAGIATHTLVTTFPGTAFEGAACAAPLRGHAGAYNHDALMLAGDYVTDDAGTGIVHIAPSHGEEDFALVVAHNRAHPESRIEIPECVGDDGTYTIQAPGFEGVHVFRAHEPVYAALTALGTLAAKGKLNHSYPHSWRSKKPVIYRATPQWFIAMDDGNAIRQKSLDAIAATHFVPDIGRNRIGAMVAGRPDWCISRQRAWGVPIAVFVEKRTGEVLRDASVMQRIVDAFRTEGADAWYQPDAAARFLGNERNPDDYEQVMDIVDVWFESGSTHAFVLPPRNLPFPADLYLEGSDQHRGWFQSSLLESVGTRGVAPFKAILTHGFVLDESGRKMSKSLGNVTAPQEVMTKYGADILRLWVMNSDTAEDLRIGKNILEQQAELYRRLRNTLRWLLGNLAGFEESERVPVAEMPELERWVLHRLTELDARIRKAAKDYDWNGVVPEIHAFCATDLSAFYFDIRKDSLYCDAKDSPRRRAARTVLDHLHRCLCAWLAPVLVFTAEEAWLSRFGDDAESIHMQDFPALPAEWRDEALAAKWVQVRDKRRDVTVLLEEKRRNALIGSSLQAKVKLWEPEGTAHLLDPQTWEEVLIVSQVSAGVFSGLEREPIEVFAAPGAKCERCWRVLPEVGASAAHPTLCRRCEAVVEG
ncbi:isoleucine--tRNA ligase [Roseococcus sp. SDR]|uniref:isoleucine--tRNA ligase n=1 Tax=Roseococcus sp. SDR TaxID=2835532 RepID=UPI001BCD8D49|nr:isoleucine--tRNA ligase [Roseococcus sp. SDR]MBS7788574.1 isoleucine--tRNA ligase [Roseococcus sp. SDR]MBV1843888.1 isoleucine--tRNA ligase [Roseococcus sp. SDR]